MTLKQQIALTGKWIAIEMYTPDTQPSKRIAAIGSSAMDCIQQLVARGLDPAIFEFRPLKPPI